MIRTHIVALSMMLCVAPMVAADPIQQAFEDGELELDLRYRYEFVDQAGFDKNAHANTLRLRLGWTTGQWKGLYARAAFDGNFALGPENYNSTANGHTDYPTVADPDDQQLNQGFIAYKGVEDVELHVIAGRQRLRIMNERYIGSVAFRQLEQVFDSARITLEPVQDLHVDYQYATRAYRVFGNHNPDPITSNQDLDAHYFTAQYHGLPVDLAAYYYGSKFEDVPENSNQNFGVRATGKPKVSDAVSLPFQAEYTAQSDFRNSPVAYNVHYVLAELGVQTRWGTAKLGYENLGSDGGKASWRAPLSTLHKFNGLADLFLTTPANGLQDVYVMLNGKVKKVGVSLRFHQFSADEGSMDYGKEFDFILSRKIGIYSGEVRFAQYWTDQAPAPGMPHTLPLTRDTLKLWLTLHMAL